MFLDPIEKDLKTRVGQTSRRVRDSGHFFQNFPFTLRIALPGWLGSEAMSSRARYCQIRLRRQFLIAKFRAIIVGPRSLKKSQKFLARQRRSFRILLANAPLVNS